MTQERQFTAVVEVAEYGGETREKKIGYFYGDDEDAVRANLEERGETVLRVEEVGVDA